MFFAQQEYLRPLQRPADWVVTEQFNTDILPAIERWEEVMAELDIQYGKLAGMFNSGGDCELFKAIDTLMEDYTDSIAAIVGDEHGWLKWHWLENNFGAERFAAKVGGTKIQVLNASHLAKVIAAHAALET